MFAAGGIVFAWQALRAPYKGYDGEATTYEVRRGTSTAQILRGLERRGVLRDAFVPVLYVKAIRRDLRPKAGVYEFRGALSPLDVLNRLSRGESLMIQITVREGLDRFALAKLMAEEGLGTEGEWLELTADSTLVEDIAPEATTLEGYLFPDTYRFSPGISPTVVVGEMVKNFRKQFGEELAYIRTGLSVHETVTLASIVETEAKLEAERPLIASVYRNRITKRMLLQADPTVIYAMKIAGTWGGNIRKDDLRMSSPYNTYARTGLPPGPIASPGLASLRAAANPAESEWLYFVAKNDGSHVFAKTLDEHNNNVAEWQKRYWKNRPEQR
ncbi:MAG: endolytic transglycosylase MltG [Acidobacteria bacterium]|nr:endolytic transglycosylase MltG [Acidobacteriota bacterium]